VAAVVVAPVAVAVTAVAVAATVAGVAVVVVVEIAETAAIAGTAGSPLVSPAFATSINQNSITLGVRFPPGGLPANAVALPSAYPSFALLAIIRFIHSPLQFSLAIPFPGM
jgi:hypothetical protein